MRLSTALRRGNGGAGTGAQACLLALVALLLLSPAPAQAQGDLLEKGLETLMGTGEGDAALGNQEIADGLREALRVGSDRVVSQVGSPDGFNLDSEIHIPLPGSLQTVQKTLRRVGLSGLADEVELRLNRAAEAAAPEARELFFKAIGEMTLGDVRGIYEGPDDAATRYFQDKMSSPLGARMRPVVDRSLAEVGALASYNRMMESYEAVPFAPDVRADLTGYVVEKALYGIFHYVAEEEAAIRNNPAARTTDLLRKVFGS